MVRKPSPVSLAPLASRSIVNSAEFRAYLESRGVSVVVARSRRNGLLFATSSSFYGPDRVHLFRLRAGGEVIYGGNSESGRERDVARFYVSETSRIRPSPRVRKPRQR